MKIDWSKFSTELRLKYGDFKLESDNTPAHVRKAIEDCAALNAHKNKWAKLNVLPTPAVATVYVEVGSILSGGYVESKSQTWYYSQEKDGQVTIYKHTHR
jgi:hypothetical protein